MFRCYFVLCQPRVPLPAIAPALLYLPTSMWVAGNTRTTKRKYVSRLLAEFILSAANGSKCQLIRDSLRSAGALNVSESGRADAVCVERAPLEPSLQPCALPPAINVSDHKPRARTTHSRIRSPPNVKQQYVAVRSVAGGRSFGEIGQRGEQLTHRFVLHPTLSAHQRSAFSKCHARCNGVYRPGVNHERLQRATSILTLQLP